MGAAEVEAAEVDIEVMVEVHMVEEVVSENFNFNLYNIKYCGFPILLHCGHRGYEISKANMLSLEQ